MGQCSFKIKLKYSERMGTGRTEKTERGGGGEDLYEKKVTITNSSKTTLDGTESITLCGCEPKCFTPGSVSTTIRQDTPQS